MNDDKISLTKNIRRKIITPENILELIDVIHEDYEKAQIYFNKQENAEQKPEQEPKFTITLLKPEGESNETKDYKKIKADNKLYNTKYEGLRVKYLDIKEDSQIEFALRMPRKRSFELLVFDEFWDNGIRISGKNEEWVRSRYDKINRIVTSWKDQCEIFNKYDGYFILLFLAFWSIIIGGAEYILLNLYKIVEIWLFPAIIGFIVALVLAVYTEERLNNLFPSIELLTGPNHLHIEEEKRKQLNWFIIVIIIPFIFVIIGLVLTVVLKL